MRHVTFLALIFLTLVCAVIWKEASRPDASSLSTELPLKPVPARPFAVADVTRIDVAGPGGADAFSIVAANGAWTVEQPFRAPAAAGAVTDLVEAVLAARGELRTDDSAKLAKFDLSDDRATTLELSNAGGDVLARIGIGRSSGEQGAFVRLLHDADDSDSAYAVTTDVRGALGLAKTAIGATEPAHPEAKHFHDLAIANVALTDTEQLRLETPLWSIRLAKQDGAWTVTEGAPADLPFKARGANDIVQQLGGQLQAQNLVDPARIKELGLDPAAYRVTAVLPDGTERRALGASDAEGKKFYVRLDAEQDPPVVYECQSWQWRKLFPQGSGLFEFPALGYDEAAIGRVIVETSDDGFDLRRKGGAGSDWEVVAPQWGLAPARSPINSVTALLRSARGIDWSSQPPGAWEPEITIRFGGENAADEELQTLLIGPAAPGGADRLAVLPNSPGVTVLLSKANIERLAPKPMELFQREVLADHEVDDLVSVRVDRGDGGSFRIDKDENDIWTLTVDGAKAVADDHAVAAWLDALTTLEVSERTDDAGPPGITVEVEGELVAKSSFQISTFEDKTVVLLGETAFEIDAPLAEIVPDAATLRASSTVHGHDGLPEHTHSHDDDTDHEEK